MHSEGGVPIPSPSSATPASEQLRTEATRIGSPTRTHRRLTTSALPPYPPISTSPTFNPGISTTQDSITASDQMSGPEAQSLREVRDTTDLSVNGTALKYTPPTLHSPFADGNLPHSNAASLEYDPDRKDAPLSQDSHMGACLPHPNSSTSASEELDIEKPSGVSLMTPGPQNTGRNGPLDELPENPTLSSSPEGLGSSFLSLRLSPVQGGVRPMRASTQPEPAPVGVTSVRSSSTRRLLSPRASTEFSPRAQQWPTPETNFAAAGSSDRASLWVPPSGRPAFARASSGDGDGTAGRKVHSEGVRFPSHEVSGDVTSSWSACPDAIAALEALQNVLLLAALSQVELQKLADCAATSTVSFCGGEVISAAGSAIDRLFICREGSCCQQQDGKQQEWGPGEVCGEAALIRSENRHTALLAGQQGARVLSLKRDSLEAILSCPLADYKSLRTSRRRLRGASIEMSIQAPPAGVSFKDLEMLRVVGTGQFGQVRLVRHRTTGEAFALKVMHKAPVSEAKQVEHILSERQVIGAGAHPFCVQLRGAFQDTNSLYLLQEWVPGGELFHHLDLEGAFTEDTTRFYAACTLLALAALHKRGIIYRDLKPENLLLDADGYLKVADFGFAKQIGGERTFTICGTPDYQAPEVIQRKGTGCAADWWALGVLIFEMATGDPPFKAMNADPYDTFQRALAGNFEMPDCLSPEACDCITQLLQVDPEDRLGSGSGGAADIMRHSWFAEIDWAALEGRRMAAPIKPILTSPFDTSNFDDFDEPPPGPKFAAGQLDKNARSWADLFTWTEPQPVAAASRRSSSFVGGALSRGVSASGSFPPSGPKTLPVGLSPALVARGGGEQSTSGSPHVEVMSASQKVQERLQPLEIPVNACDVLIDAQRTPTSGRSEASSESECAITLGGESMQSHSSANGGSAAAVDVSFPVVFHSQAVPGLRSAYAEMDFSEIEVMSEPGGSQSSTTFGGSEKNFSVVPEIPMFMAGSDGLVSPLASSGRINLEVEPKENSFVVTHDGLVSPRALSGRIVLEFEDADTDKFIVPKSGFAALRSSVERVFTPSAYQ